ncbi:hypothetical protein L1987_62977 [Smallanthus sonchifolius]|uniref:Uncharacterized protein n=1 Tax=Smallanthus sonchifolius TaxID=185202 RepID=A0ACB9CC27_9ASTR|nr:hypothetical protein L1987_62977 [Smallanthus sonchifolius]
MTHVLYLYGLVQFVKQIGPKYIKWSGRGCLPDYQSKKKPEKAVVTEPTSFQFPIQNLVFSGNHRIRRSFSR